MKKFYVGIKTEVSEFNQGEVILASPITGDGDNYMTGDGQGIGGIGELN